MSVAVDMRRIATGEAVRVICKDLGLRRYKGAMFLTSRFQIEGRKRAVVSRVDRDLAELTGIPHRFREAEDLAVLERAGVCT